ncbi:MAG: ATP synthase subunit I [Cyanothece sp. SIO1E1]|nr:ATP synthase subunit I [Cyanothece sp. SIO1E1]
MDINMFAFMVALITGLGLGLFYFGGLWFTVRRLPKAKRPILVMAVSFLLRLGISLSGVYLILIHLSGVQLMASLLAYILGFLLVRNLLIHRLQHREKLAL